MPVLSLGGCAAQAHSHLREVADATVFAMLTTATAAGERGRQGRLTEEPIPSLVLEQKHFVTRTPSGRRRRDAVGTCAAGRLLAAEGIRI